MSGFDYGGRVGIVTGASSGIGRAVALDLAERGVRIALMARREEALRETLEAAQRFSPASMMRVGDVGDRATCEQLVAGTLSAFGRIDFLVNNAGVNRLIAVTEMKPEDVESAFRVNFFGCVHMTLAVLPAMLARGEGWIVNMGSGSSHIGLPEQAIYTATKHALRGFSEGMWHDLQGTGIRVSLINPGTIDTPMLDGLATQGGTGRVADPSLRRFPPTAIADAVRRAIETGRYELAAPRRFGLAFWLHDALPGLMRRAIAADHARRRGRRS